MNISKKLAIGIVVAILVGITASGFILASVMNNLQNQMEILQKNSAQLEENYKSSLNQIGMLQDKYSRLEVNYTNLQNQNNQIQDKYTQLLANFTALFNELNPNLEVTYWKQQQVLAGTGVDYVFNVTGTRETSELAPGDTINQALAPLVGKYPFVTVVTLDGITIPFWMSQYVHSGKFTFSLRIESQLTNDQLQSLTQDLTNAFKNL